MIDRWMVDWQTTLSFSPDKIQNGNDETILIIVSSHTALIDGDQQVYKHHGKERKKARCG
jgi:hypothetical protein